MGFEGKAGNESLRNTRRTAGRDIVLKVVRIWSGASIAIKLPALSCVSVVTRPAGSMSGLPVGLRVEVGMLLCYTSGLWRERQPVDESRAVHKRWCHYPHFLGQRMGETPVSSARRQHGHFGIPGTEGQSSTTGANDPKAASRGSGVRPSYPRASRRLSSRRASAACASFLIPIF